MEITIKEQTYKVKYSIRSLFIFEQIKGKTFTLESLLDQYIFFYSMILANNPECTLTFDQFIDECDEDFTLVTSLQKYITEVFAKQAQLNKADEGDSKKK
ncbi:MAG: hypothetical protein ACK5HZ_01245 [Macellibacteroides fermentans]|uniref:hypothetical protein n=1 Tax=Macellibacteroides fermentans TaxID=879969 RepID=UPI003ACA4E2A